MKTTQTERFTGRALAYDRYRLRYPAEPILALMRDWCGLEPEYLVADIGAGTGMLAEVFLENGNKVYAVEPNAQMRSACEQLTERWPRLHVVDATAEKTGLETASMDLISVGRAFHWFDKERALAEFRRVLKPRRWVALISLGRAKDKSAATEAYERLLLEHGTDYEYVRAGYRIHENMEALFPAELRQQQIAGQQRITWEELVGQTLSLSVAPLPEDPRYLRMIEALEEFFERFAQDSVLTLGTTCWITCGRFE